MADPRKIYWDACVWLGLINEEEAKLAVCQHVIDQAKAGEVEIWTSTYTLAEVHKRKCEGKTKELAEAQDVIFEEFMDQDFVQLAQVDADVGTRARRLLREHQVLDKVPDAIHLATAALNNVDEMHTFDGSDLLPLSGLVDTDDGRKLTICPPPDPPLETTEVAQTDLISIMEAMADESVQAEDSTEEAEGATKDTSGKVQGDGSEPGVQPERSGVRGDAEEAGESQATTDSKTVEEQAESDEEVKPSS